jgi:hypothetical protein
MEVKPAGSVVARGIEKKAVVVRGIEDKSPASIVAHLVALYGVVLGVIQRYAVSLIVAEVVANDAVKA